ncbi:MAG: DUF5012 domain-containing protein [Rikenellaceae bacterium]
MKKLIYSLFLLAAVGSFTSCHEVTTEDTSKVTYYATLELLGESTILWSLGEEYVDPGYVAELNGEDVSSTVVVTGSVDTSTPGIYTLLYQVFNEDGFGVSDTRTVMVSDSSASPIESGFWTLQPGSYRNYSGTISNFSGFPITVLQLEPGIFYVSDLIGGYYDQGVGYGSDYAMVGYFQLNDDNSIDILSGDVSGWGDSMDSYENAYYDEATGTINWDVAYAGVMVFHISLGL